ncbi:DUF2384 domain-containing protein [Vibrio parahaemolyticus]|nr:DUF2384 domain-containing protein [Vibrio parahaemolyticus]
MDTQTLLTIIEVENSPFSKELIKMLDEADSYFEDREASIAWLNRPNLVFNFHKPLSICDDVEGVKRVIEQLSRLKFGNLA